MQRAGRQAGSSTGCNNKFHYTHIPDLLKTCSRRKKKPIFKWRARQWTSFVKFFFQFELNIKVSTLQARAVETTMMSTWQVFGILFFFCYVAQLWLIESFVLCAILSFFAISFNIMRTHGHPIVVSLPACIYWNSYRTWRWAGSRWVLQYLQATASPAAILRLIGGHQPFLFALTLFGFSIYLPPSWSSIFILRHCWCQKIFQKRIWALICPFSLLLPFWSFGKCNTNFLCLDDIFKKSKYGSYVIFFQSTRPTYEKVYDKSAGEWNNHQSTLSPTNDQLDISGL